MPTYDYRCAKCGEDFEVFQSFSEDPLKRHPGCGGKVAKVMSAAGIVLKGSGFYKTDSADSARARSKQRSESSPSSSESKSDAKTDTKSEPSPKNDSKNDSKPTSKPKPESKTSSAA
jgi:putative FmdB family regulatory protein